jgi:hypothetical protein
VANTEARNASEVHGIGDLFKGFRVGVTFDLLKLGKRIFHR